MPIDLGRRLITAGVVPAEEVEAALFLAIVRGIPFPRALVDRGAVTERGLEEELERRGGLALRNVVGVPELVARLPRAMCRRLCAIPTRLDPYTGTVDVAAADPIDPHLAVEFGFHLGAPIRIIRALLTAVEEAIRRVELGDVSPAAPRGRRATPAFPHGAPDSTQPPPPPPEELPIPLVRRAGVSLIDPDSDEPQTRRRAGADNLDGPPLPLRQLKTLVSERAVLDDEAPPGSRAAASKPRLMILYDPAEQPVAISFPSAPPPPDSRASGAQDGAGGGREPPGASDERAMPTVRQPRGARLDAVAAVPPPTLDVTAYPIVPLDEEATAVVGRITDVPADAPSSEASEIPGPITSSSRADLRAAETVRLPSAERAADTVRTSNAAPQVEEEPPPLPFADPGVILQKLDEAASRDEVVRLTLRGLRLIARRIAVFVVKRDGFQGWACNADLGEEAALRAILIPHDHPSILATAAAAGLYLGPIPPTPAHAQLLALMAHASSDVAAVAVRAGNRPAMVLLADELGDPMLSTRRMDELARATGAALSRLLAAKE